VRSAPDDPELLPRSSSSDLPLFAPEAPADTRRASRDAIADRKKLLCDQLIAAYVRRGPMTADEAAAAIGETVLAVRPRITELQQDGKLFDTGKRRPNASGRSATVWDRR
jgi:hypothetical protein